VAVVVSTPQSRQGRWCIYTVAMIVVVPPEKPADDVARWQPTLRYLQRVVDAEGVRLDEVHLHHHPRRRDGRRRVACFCAEADWETHTLTLCGGQDRQTILHEVGHLIVEDYHTAIWSAETMRLHRVWLPAHRVQHADRLLAMEYRKARGLYRAVYGAPAPRSRNRE